MLALGPCRDGSTIVVPEPVHYVAQLLRFDFKRENPGKLQRMIAQRTAKRFRKAKRICAALLGRERWTQGLRDELLRLEAVATESVLAGEARRRR